MVTGGTGSIGGLLTIELAKLHKRVLVYSRNDSRQHKLKSVLAQLGLRKNVIFAMGDVRDQQAVFTEIVRHRVDTVYHCAAVKHVGAYDSPAETADVNINGTRSVLNAVEAASYSGGKDIAFILLSTDKAASPVNVMGASKWIAEEVVRESTRSGYQGGGARGIVRFGNVLNSSGSVIPTMVDRLLENGEVYVTDPEATRWFVTKQEAVDILLQARDSLVGPAYGGTMAYSSMRCASVEQFARMANYVVNGELTAPAMVLGGLSYREKKHEEMLSPQEVATEFVGHPGIALIRRAIPGEEVPLHPHSGDTPRINQDELVNLAELILGEVW